MRNLIKTIFVTTFTATLVSTPVLADSDKSVSLLTAYAKSGDKIAQAKLGHLYKTGTGVERNLELSEKWYDAVAENLNPEQLYEFATEFANGSTSVDRNPLQAYKLYQLSSSQGSKQADHTLGARYEQGYSFGWDD